MIFLFLKFINSWGPLFHQLLSIEFLEEFLPYLNKTQKNCFIQGSVYIDSLPRSKFHNFTYLLNFINNNDINQSNSWWFKEGMLLHLVVDLFGHFGKPYSFLPLKKSKHYITELSSCSYILKFRNLSKIKPNKISKKILIEAGNNFSFIFFIFYKIWFFFSKINFYLLLP